MADRQPLPSWIVEPGNRLIRRATRVPPAGDPAACPSCHGPSPPLGHRCSDCTRLRTVISRAGGQVAEPLIPVVLVDPSVQGGDPFAAWFAWRDPYELEVHGWSGEHPAPSAPTTGVLSRLSAMLIRFLHAHQACVGKATGGWDLIVPVPDGPRPTVGNALLGALRRFGYPAAPLLASKQPILPGEPSPDAFALHQHPPDPPGSVLLLDAAVRTGTRLHSAAWTLQHEGVPVVGAVALARVMTPSTEAEALLTRHRGRFTWERCAVHTRPQATGQQELFR